MMAAGNGFTGWPLVWCRPSRVSVSRTLQAPSCETRATNAVLIDREVAWARLIGPPPAVSSLRTSHLPRPRPHASGQSERVYMGARLALAALASPVALIRIPRSNAVTEAKAFSVDAEAQRSGAPYVVSTAQVAWVCVPSTGFNAEL